MFTLEFAKPKNGDRIPNMDYLKSIDLSQNIYQENTLKFGTQYYGTIHQGITYMEPIQINENSTELFKEYMKWRYKDENADVLMRESVDECKINDDCKWVDKESEVNLACLNSKLYDWTDEMISHLASSIKISKLRDKPKDVYIYNNSNNEIYKLCDIKGYDLKNNNDIINCNIGLRWNNTYDKNDKKWKIFKIQKMNISLRSSSWWMSVGKPIWIKGDDCLEAYSHKDIGSLRYKWINAEELLILNNIFTIRRFKSKLIAKNISKQIHFVKRAFIGKNITNKILSNGTFNLKKQRKCIILDKDLNLSQFKSLFQDYDIATKLNDITSSPSKTNRNIFLSLSNIKLKFHDDGSYITISANVIYVR